MLSNERQSQRSSRSTSRSEPALPPPRLNRQSSDSSGSEDNQGNRSEYARWSHTRSSREPYSLYWNVCLVPAAPPLPSAFGRSNVTPPVTPSESVSSTPTPVTYKPPVRTPPSTNIFQPKPLRPSTLSDTSPVALATSDRSSMETKPKSKLNIGGLTRVSARDIEKGKYPTISKLVSTPLSRGETVSKLIHSPLSREETSSKLVYSPLSRGGKSHQSIFEKVDIRNRRTSFLGSGSYSQLEDCIKDCLARDRRHPPQRNHSVTRHYSPSRSLTRASVLEDYSYDGIIAPNHHYVPRSRSRYHDLDYHHHNYHHHHHQPHHTRSPVDLSLTEIRHVNDALAKYGIAVFSHEDHHHHGHRRNHSVGNIISACQLLIHDPALAAYTNGSSAVRNAWDHAAHAQVPPYPGGYGSPPAQGPGSNFYNPNNPAQNAPSNPFYPPNNQSAYPPQAPSYPPMNQPPNNAGRSVLANLFSGQPQQSSYPPPPPPMNQPPNSSGRNVLANLFGQPQQQSYPPPPPMNQPPNNAGRSVLANLFGQPQQNPNNNYRPYWFP